MLGVSSISKSKKNRVPKHCPRLPRVTVHWWGESAKANNHTRNGDLVMSDFFSKIQMLDSIITVIAVISAAISWLLSIFKSKDISKVKRYIFLLSLSCWGISSGILLISNIQLGAIISSVLLVTVILFGQNHQLLLNSIIDSNTTVIVTKNAMYNVFCETIQRICLALVDDVDFDGNEIRVSIFAVDWKSKELALAGRYPIISDDIPEIKYKIGRGTSGVSADSNRIVKVENLPQWNDGVEQYIKMLNNYNISADEIKHFRTKARCYYAFPIVERDSSEGVNIVRFVVSVDSVHPTISSSNSTSENWINVIIAYIHNNRQLLFKTFIGKGF
jgi:hypothetical protein